MGELTLLKPGHAEPSRMRGSRFSAETMTTNGAIKSKVRRACHAKSESRELRGSSFVSRCCDFYRGSGERSYQ